MPRPVWFAILLSTVLLRFSILTATIRASDETRSKNEASTETQNGSTVDYERDIKPLLLHKCAACHGALKQNSGLRLDAGQLIRTGGDSGPVIDPANSHDSLLIQRVTTTDASLRMPPPGEGEKLSNSQITLLQRWIEQGAVSPIDEMIPEDPKTYWSYQSPVRPDVPSVQNSDWVRNPVDAFIAAEHEQRQLIPSAAAPKEIWLRRVFLDLIGIPPTRAELHAFLHDVTDEAYENVVDELLSRPQYGERWGRHWMDVWRYSDWYGSRGINEIRYSQRHIWRWRDWIVESLNTDKPYDQMVIEMLAADEIAAADPDILRATGFLGRNWYKFDRNVWMFDTVEHTSQAFLGLTLKCARCHDHKFDPITQDDYYHFRAFFEPHDLRTDPISGNTDTEKDATLGQVLREGVSRVFDKNANVKTFVFQRGDDRYPDESRLMLPAVPKSLGTLAAEIEQVSLPVDAWYPQLRSAVANGLIATAKSNVTATQQQLSKAREGVSLAEAAVVEFEARQVQQSPSADTIDVPVLHDDFAVKSDIWKVVSGQWQWQDSKLTESSVGNFATIMADVVLPRNFQARVKYRTLSPGTYRSVGLSFDYVDTGNSQDIYTSTGDTTQSIQAFHRTNGKQEYPTPGIVKTTLRVGDVSTVEFVVRDQQLTLHLNGQHKLDYTMPIARREGKLALWVHSGTAEFLEVDIRELVPDLRDLQQQALTAKHRVALAEAHLTTLQDELTALKARFIAERAKHYSEPTEIIQETALAASRSERQVAVSKANEERLAATQFLESTLAASHAISDSTANENNESVTIQTSAANENANQILTAAQKKLDEARLALDNADGSYTPIGETFPKSSTGRRLALAKWIVGTDNPRASRVAVNHIWLRHFGEALVPTVANFGLNGQPPSNAPLLNWLAVELSSNGWHMKPIHRLIVLSATYRQSSTTPAMTETSHNNVLIDPNNQFLWRMNSRRMESEAVRDSLLSVAGALDLSRGGPELSEKEAESVMRRSLYFRSTPNEKSGFLNTFDAANPNECYRRQESVVPQQALALMNSAMALEQSRQLANRLSHDLGDSDDADARTSFIVMAMETILNRPPNDAEIAACAAFLKRNTETVGIKDVAAFPASASGTKTAAAAISWLRARENLVHVLFSHNDFVTIR